MTRFTIVVLVLLRLAIGWHFVFEGYEKFTSPSWSSEGYLRESSGPLAPMFRQIAGDPLADRLTPRPFEAKEDPSKAKFHEYMPPVLEKEWQAWFDRFTSHYKLSEKQHDDAETKFRQSEDAIVSWMLNTKKPITRVSPYGPPVQAEKTIPEWIEEYRSLTKQAEEIEKNELPRSRDKLTTAEINRRINKLKIAGNDIRVELRADLNHYSTDMRESVGEVLNREQWDEPRLSSSMKVSLWKRDLLGWIDFLVPLALVIIGGGLLLGLFTRTMCVAGALLLLSFYLAMPPLPWTPENLRVEGHYLIINKNIVEMLALLALATTWSGRWFGLDSVLRDLCCRGKKVTEAQPAPPTPSTQK
jgi:uncharacterized membrane protein YphA (DoxX/SURF4 family)